MSITAQLADGRKLEFPDGTDPAVIQRTVKSVLGQQTEPAAVQAGRGLMEIPRQVGLTARYGLEGLAQVGDIIHEPIRALVNLGSGDQPRAPKSLTQMASGLADTLGLPSPEGANERVIGDATRMVAGAGGMAGATGAAARGATGVTQKVLQAMSANPGQQAVSAAAAGSAGGSVREAGGGPAEQFAASLLAGLAAPLGMMGAKKVVDAAGNVVKTAYNPQQVEVVLKTELAKQGVNWDELGRKVQLQLAEDARKAVYSGQPMNAEALARLADYRRVGATPLVGDITQDPSLLTQQRNLAKQLANTTMKVTGGDLPGIQNENAKRVLQTFEGAATSPMDEYATGKGIIDSVTAADAARTAQKSALYAAAREAGGRDVPLARGAFVNKAFENLARENKTAFLPAEVGNMLDTIAKAQVVKNGQAFDVPFDVNTIDQLETILASASRGAKDGNAKAAIKAVRDALGEVDMQSTAKREFAGQPLTTPQMAQAMQAADALPAQAMNKFRQARSAAASQFKWRESSRFIEDALGGAAPDKFVKTHVIGAPVEDLAALRNQIANSPELVNGVRKQLIDYIMQRGTANPATTTFSGAGLEKGLKALGDRKLALFFDPDEIAQIKAAVNVARLSQSQPIGSAVNNSNSAAMYLGKLGDMLGKATGIPVAGPMIAQPLQSLTFQAQTIPMRNLSSGLISPQFQNQQPRVLPIAALLAAPSAYGREDQEGR